MNDAGPDLYDVELELYGGKKIHLTATRGEWDEYTLSVYEQEAGGHGVEPIIRDKKIKGSH